MAITFYNYVLSGNCYKFRLLANLLQVEYTTVTVDFHPGQEHLSPALLALNPAGTIPILVIDDQIITETQAMLLWLAIHHDTTNTWWPAHEPDHLTTVMEWLGIASRLSSTVGELRLHTMLNYPTAVTEKTRGAIGTLREIESRLTEQSLRGSQWLAGTHPTIADIACFPYVALSADAGIEHDDYPAIRHWVHAIKSLPRFITMPGIFELHERHAEDSSLQPPGNDGDSSDVTT